MHRAVFKVRILWLVPFAILVGAWPMAAQAAAPGPAAGFAVLSAAPGGGGAVACTTSTINGNVGSSGGSASVANVGCTITGTVTAPVSAQVVADFNSAYSALAGVPCDHTLATLDLTQTLAPGVYCFPAAATATDKVLTLNGPASGIWLFKIGTGGTGALTGTRFSVVMAGGGQPCNVNWWVAEAATLTVTTTTLTPFQGNILAGAAATVTGDAAATSALTLNGRVWAGAGVTVTDSNIVGCAATAGIPVPKTKCKSDTSTDQDKDSKQSNDGDARQVTDAAGRDQSAKSTRDGEHGDENGDHGRKDCESKDSDTGHDKKSDSDKGHDKKSGD
jgi:hypothetical protein